MDIFTEGSVIIMDLYFIGQKWWFKVLKNILKIDLFLTNMQFLSSQGVDYLWIIVMFLSAVWTLILTAPIHCRWSIGEQVMECYISPNLFWSVLLWRNGHMNEWMNEWIISIWMFLNMNISYPNLSRLDYLTCFFHWVMRVQPFKQLQHPPPWRKQLFALLYEMKNVIRTHF